MKKLILLALFGIIPIFIGCGSTSHHSAALTKSKNALIRTTIPKQGQHDNLGLHLSLTQKSSLNVDMEGIIDYLQGTTVIESLAKQQAIQPPWICFTASF